MAKLTGKQMFDTTHAEKVSQSRCYSVKSLNMSFEVDYEEFVNNVWPKVAYQARRLSPLVVRTEIFSKIKEAPRLVPARSGRH